MQDKWPQLSQFEYPGRFLILGRTDASYFAIYGVTARSESSRAKIYVFDRLNNTIKVQATNPEIMAQGNQELLDYNAARIFRNCIIIGNGKQVDLVKIDGGSINSLVSSLNVESFEPDQHNTPRITGMISIEEGKVSAAMYLITANDELQPQHEAFDLELKPGQAYFISTYSGENTKPTPSFNTNPILLEIDFKSSEDAAQQIYNHFAPKPDQPDLRVSVIAIETDNKIEEKSVTIINYAS